MIQPRLSFTEKHCHTYTFNKDIKYKSIFITNELIRLEKYLMHDCKYYHPLKIDNISDEQIQSKGKLN